MDNLRYLPGKPLPQGATVISGGVNFSVFSRNGTGVILELFRAAGDDAPYASYSFDAKVNRTGDVWHVFVAGLGAAGPDRHLGLQPLHRAFQLLPPCLDMHAIGPGHAGDLSGNDGARAAGEGAGCPFRRRMAPA